MAGSTSSISSNEGGGANPIATGRGYNLTAAPTGGGDSQSTQTSRTQTPPPPSVAQQNTSTAASSSPTAASRNALGITHGWGVGLAHSGSYLATSVRMTSTIPMLVEDPETYDAIKSIMIKKKAREQSQLELRAKQQAAKRKLPTAEEQEKASEKREAAVLKITQGREKLKKLLHQRDELEKSIKSEWDEKIETFKKDSLQKEEEAINALKSKHEEEIKQLRQAVDAQNKADEDELEAKLSEMEEEKKRKAMGVKGDAAPTASENTSDLNVALTSSKQKTDEPLKEGETTEIKEKSAGASELYDDLFESPAKPAQKEEKADDSDHELFGDSDDEAEKSPGDQKKEELKNITEELNDLNRVKSQMVWLLKQVITAEAKLKMKQKMQAK